MLIKRQANVLNAALKFAISVIDRLILVQAAREHLENKSKIGKTPRTFKNAKNVKVWSKK